MDLAASPYFLLQLFVAVLILILVHMELSAWRLLMNMSLIPREPSPRQGLRGDLEYARSQLAGWASMKGEKRRMRAWSAGPAKQSATMSSRYAGSVEPQAGTVNTQSQPLIGKKQIPWPAPHVTYCSYDPASVALLQRIDRLEDNLSSLVKQTYLERRPSSGNDNFPDSHGSFEPHSPDAGLSRRERSQEAPPPSASLLRASQDMRIESMIQWPIFDAHLHTRGDSYSARQLMVDVGSSEPRVDISFSIDVHLNRENVEFLLESFLANILPSSPILDPIEVRQRVQEVLDGGLRWDGHSCLVVSLQMLP